MNKYQVALNELCSRCYVESEKCTCHPKYKGGKCNNNCEHKQILQELVDKETPKEVINTGTEIFCPKCGKMFNFVIGGNGLCVTIPQYCEKCGQKLGSEECE